MNGQKMGSPSGMPGMTCGPSGMPGMMTDQQTREMMHASGTAFDTVFLTMTRLGRLAHSPSATTVGGGVAPIAACEK